MQCCLIFFPDSEFEHTTNKQHRTYNIRSNKRMQNEYISYEFTYYMKTFIEKNMYDILWQVIIKK